MGLGKRVRLSRPPKGLKQWEDQTATVLTLIPVAKHPLEYKIRMDNDSGTVLTVPQDALEPLKLKEEREEGVFACLIVNDLMYCGAHQLEVCGDCGVDHRMTNYQHEADIGYELADEMIEGMMKLNSPARSAPQKRSRSVGVLANKAAFKVVVNEHVCLLQKELTRGQTLDPSMLDPWPASLPTEPAIRSHSNFLPGSADCMPEFAKLPVRRVRETLVASSRNWDGYLKSPNFGKEPMMRLMYQDEAQTQVLSLDLLLPIRTYTVPSTGVTVPLYIVRWAHFLASNQRGAMQLMGTMQRNTRMGEIPVEVDEIALLIEVLKANAEQFLNPVFLRSQEHPTHSHILNVSVITPISREMQSSYYQSLGKFCQQCGTSQCSTMMCARCHLVAYCSKECQKKNWKHHKKMCASS